MPTNQVVEQEPRMPTMSSCASSIRTNTLDVRSENSFNSHQPRESSLKLDDDDAAENLPSWLRVPEHSYGARTATPRVLCEPYPFRPPWESDVERGGMSYSRRESPTREGCSFCGTEEDWLGCMTGQSGRDTCAMKVTICVVLVVAAIVLVVMVLSTLAKKH